LNRFGAQLIDDVFNPDNWNNWGDAGKKILHELMMEMLQLAALNPLKNLLFGSSLPTLSGGAGGGGLLGNIFGAVAGLFGGSSGGAAAATGVIGPRAGGGNVQAGQLYHVNENGIEGFRPAQSGTIVPLGRMRAANDGGGTTVLQTFVLDARYGVTTPELLRHVNQVATARAAQAGRSAYEAGQKDLPARVQRLNKLGS
jgi:hypothetical protein